MMHYWLPLFLLLISGPAAAGLFADDEARQRIETLEARIVKLEQALVRSEEDSRARIRALLDLQMQLEAQAAEVRKLRGENEEKQHGLLEIEQRQKALYLDLDTRLKRLESTAAGARPVLPAAAAGAEGRRDVPENPVGENKAFEVAYSLYRAEDYQRAALAFRDFLRQFPQSVHEANVYYWIGNAYFLSDAFADAIESYQVLAEKYPDHPRVPEALLNIAESQVRLKNKAAAKTTLKQIISQFPGSDAADKAKKRLAALK